MRILMNNRRLIKSFVMNVFNLPSTAFPLDNLTRSRTALTRKRKWLSLVLNKLEVVFSILINYLQEKLWVTFLLSKPKIKSILMSGVH